MTNIYSPTTILSHWISFVYFNPQEQCSFLSDHLFFGIHWFSLVLATIWFSIWWWYRRSPESKDAETSTDAPESKDAETSTDGSIDTGDAPANHDDAGNTAPKAKWTCSFCGARLSFYTQQPKHLQTCVGYENYEKRVEAEGKYSRLLDEHTALQESFINLRNENEKMMANLD